MKEYNQNQVKMINQDDFINKVCKIMKTWREKWDNYLDWYKKNRDKVKNYGQK